LRGNCDTRPAPEAAVCLSLDPERSGDLFVVPQPGSMIHDSDHDSITHGSPNDDDTTVPVIVWGPRVPAGRVEGAASALQVAPTLAKLLGIAPPPAATAAPLY